MPLNLFLDETEEMLKKSAQDFMHRDGTKEIIKKIQNSGSNFHSDIWRKITGMGWLGIIIPEEFGGMGGTYQSAGQIFEVLGTGPLPGPYFSSSILGALIILECGNIEQKKQVLPEITSGNAILSLAHTEPTYDWGMRGISTTAEISGDNIVIKGKKLFIHDAGAASHLIVTTRIKNSFNKPTLAVLLLDKHLKGISIRKMSGFLVGDIYQVDLDSVKAPLSTILSGNKDVTASLQKAFLKAIPLLSAYQVGGCQDLLEMSLEYSRIRIQFTQAIGRFQRVQDLIIEIANQLEAARWCTYEALWKLDANLPFIESGHLAKVVASEAYWQSATLAHQVFSGISYSKEHHASFHTRASRYLYNFLGEPCYHRQELAKILLDKNIQRVSSNVG